jgi:hypothetical protein
MRGQHLVTVVLESLTDCASGMNAAAVTPNGAGKIDTHVL